MRSRNDFRSLFRSINRGVLMKSMRSLIAVVGLVITSGEPAFAVGCPPPGAFAEGRIHGIWVGVVLDFKGEPAGPHAATVYTTTMAPGGFFLTTLGSVKAQGDGAAELRAMFVNQRLYIVNNRYAPGSTNHQYEYLSIQRFDIQLGKLIPEDRGIVNLSRVPQNNPSPMADCSDVSGFDKALRKVIASGMLERIWIPLTNRTP